ncbi:MAG: Coenzyme F420 hydrogenase/dehydrogenase, beta subunit C-terminal domain [Oscillospiraceae bacterium]|nr:Coenzyme F420 hydrogenase/dehydrogenase, beta subunit C-terminal domain [Oscillospiraceae bacterium]
MPDFELPQLAPRDRCTGCGACANGCPKNAIHMLPDREGFCYPTVTDACVQCGHCTHICPVLKQREKRSAPAVFAAWNPDRETRMVSTAGGVFALLADYVLESGGVVFGAAVDEELHVRHVAVTSPSELSSLLGSKPIQSEIGNSYDRVRRYLERGRRVLFSGTPCQVDGLYRYLGEYPENLLTVDVLCRGVSSPGVWAHLVRSMAYVKRKRPVAVSFYSKLSGVRDRRFRVRFEDGSHFDAPYDKSELGRGHRRGLFLRTACHTCPYATTDRPGDLTLGQFRGLPKDFYPHEQKQGISLLLVNTAKGAQTVDVLPLKKELRTLAEAMVANPALSTPIPAPAERTAFFNAFAQQPFQQVRNRFLAPLAYQAKNRGKGLWKLLVKKPKEDRKPLWKKR